MSKTPEIEKVARAICAKDGRGAPDSPGETYGFPRWRQYEPHARAALEAVREPSDAMLEAAAHEEDKKECAAIYRAMIGAALGDDKRATPKSVPSVALTQARGASTS